MHRIPAINAPRRPWRWPLVARWHGGVRGSLLGAALLGSAMPQPAAAQNSSPPLSSGQSAIAPLPLRPAPTLVAPLMGGPVFDLAAARGVVVLHLWASWCPPCRVEMPVLDHFARAHHDVRVVGLSFDTKRDAGAVARAMAGLSFPTAMAGQARVNGFGTPGELPQTLVIDPRGWIVARFGGGHPPLSEAALARAVSGARTTAQPAP